MQIITTINEMKAWSAKARGESKTLGFVPTMGYLHKGHMSLVHKSLTECDVTIVSSYVNPAQFGPSEDLDTYPSAPEKDRDLLLTAGVDILFRPTAGEIYPKGYKTYVSVEGITAKLCGISRPDFFRGVTTVVLKLFNIVAPDKAYFGEKDWQQLAVIETMVRDLNMDVEIRRMPLLRENDGLAMSSRNRYLDSSERNSALLLSRALKMAQEKTKNGERSANKIRDEIRQIINESPQAKIDYITLCDPENFEEVTDLNGKTLAALAIKVGSARLIDNCILESV
jgi:pantoate--beta-alanine ligase